MSANLLQRTYLSKSYILLRIIRAHMHTYMHATDFDCQRTLCCVLICLNLSSKVLALRTCARFGGSDTDNGVLPSCFMAVSMARTAWWVSWMATLASAAFFSARRKSFCDFAFFATRFACSCCSTLCTIYRLSRQRARSQCRRLCPQTCCSELTSPNRTFYYV